MSEVKYVLPSLGLWATLARTNGLRRLSGRTQGVRALQVGDTGNRAERRLLAKMAKKGAKA